MSISLMEQETTINFSRDERYAFIWTSDSTVMTKLDKRVEGGEYDLLSMSAKTNMAI